MEFKDLTLEQQEKAKTCKTPEDILALAKEEGYELSSEQLEALSGGRERYEPSCPGNDPCSPYDHPAV